MKQVRLHGANDVRGDDIPEPTPGPRGAVVRIAACGICGTDLTFIRAGSIGAPGAPACLGHEMAGAVEWVGPEITDVHVGARVAVHPGFGEGGFIGNGGPEGGLTELLLV